MMKRLLLSALLLASVAVQADVWKTKKGSGSDSHLNPAFWVDVETGKTSPTALSADDEYWIIASQAFVARKYNSASVFPGGILNLGASSKHKPTDSLASGSFWGAINGKDSLTFPNLVWYNGRFYNNIGSKLDHTLTYSGMFTLRADDDKSASEGLPQFGLTVSGGIARCLTIAADLVSEDDKPVVTVYGDGVSFEDFIGGHSWVRFTGDNSGYKGTFAVNCDDFANAAIRIASDTALGDPSVVTNAALRLGNKSGLRVDKGVTLTFKSTMAITGKLGKDGPGIMAFGGRMTSAHPLYVCEGYIAALATNALDRAQVSFGSLTDGGIAIDGSADSDGLADYGIVQISELTAVPPEGVKIKVKLINWAKSKGGVTRAILTVPAKSADLTDAFDLTASRGFTGALSKRVNADGSTTYLGTFEPSGVTVFR